jgi:hypothetical protein
VRIYPPVTQDEARQWLTTQATAAYGAEAAAELATDIAICAEAMAVVSSVSLPDDIEPLYP